MYLNFDSQKIKICHPSPHLNVRGNNFNRPQEGENTIREYISIPQWLQIVLSTMQLLYRKYTYTFLDLGIFVAVCAD